jgi:hypothetical protein
MGHGITQTRAAMVCLCRHEGAHRQAHLHVPTLLQLRGHTSGSNSKSHSCARRRSCNSYHQCQVSYEVVQEGSWISTAASAQICMLM